MTTHEQDMNSTCNSGPCLYDLLRLETNLPPTKPSCRQSKEEANLPQQSKEEANLPPTKPSCRQSNEEANLPPTKPSCRQSKEEANLPPTKPSCRQSKEEANLPPTKPSCRQSKEEANLPPTKPSCSQKKEEENLPPTKPSCWQSKEESPSSPHARLDKILSQPGNALCADCGSIEPRWVSLNIGSFMCIKCSGVHRSLGVHISKVFSVKLDEWTNEQVDAFEELGGNTAVNSKYEAYIPDNVSKPKPDASIEERTDFIRRKYEMQQFMIPDASLCCPFPCKPSSKSAEKHSNHKGYSLGLAFRNSWRRTEKPSKKSSSMAGMVEFIGLIKVNVVRGTNLAVRDMVTSDPYVILSLGHQIVKTRVIKNNLNPVWNEKLMLSIPESVPPLKLLVYDKDTFTNDDFMGEAEIDIQPLVTAAKATELVKIEESMQLGKWVSSADNTLVSDGIINLIDGKVKQDIVLKLQNVERGVLQLELECVPLTQ